MKIKTLLLAGTAVAFSATFAQAADIRPYAGLKIGAASQKIHFILDGDKTNIKKTKVFGSIEAGASFGTTFGTFRTGLEYTYRDKMTKKYEGGEIKGQAQSLFLQAYYELPVTFFIKPYLNAGLGYSRLMLEAQPVGEAKEKEHKNKFGWNAGVGLAMNVSKAFSIDLGYRYADLGKFVDNDDGSKDEAKFKNHEFYLGARYKF